MIRLRQDQIDALGKMKNGCILCGGVGSGKSMTGLAYYVQENGGSIVGDEYIKMTSPKDLYIITTAHKRDLREWETEMIPFMLTTHDDLRYYDHKVVVDSWNNIKKYNKVYNAFFIFDEDKVTGSGVWVKSFLSIARKNRWIILSATPGDCWADYTAVFVANGFYQNKTEFYNKHVVYKPYVKFPMIDRYLGETILEKYRNSILVNINYKRHTVRHEENIRVSFPKEEYLHIMKERWNPFTNWPIKNASEFCFTLRKIVNSDPSRGEAVLNILYQHNKVIVFYNYDFELDILKSLEYPEDCVVAEWNHHNHDPLPKKASKWVYLVQYAAGSEGWNCIETNAIVFYSLNYSYKAMEQSRGRIDRANTPFIDLYYYYLVSVAGIDQSIQRTLNRKKTFNARGFYTKNTIGGINNGRLGQYQKVESGNYGIAGEKNGARDPKGNKEEKHHEDYCSLDDHYSDCRNFDLNIHKY